MTPSSPPSASPHAVGPPLPFPPPSPSLLTNPLPPLRRQRLPLRTIHRPHPRPLHPNLPLHPRPHLLQRLHQRQLPLPLRRNRLLHQPPFRPLHQLLRPLPLHDHLRHRPPRQPQPHRPPHNRNRPPRLPARVPPVDPPVHNRHPPRSRISLYRSEMVFCRRNCLLRGVFRRSDGTTYRHDGDA